eukprot:jgi/Hompol1/203/HPOL_002440-RA
MLQSTFVRLLTIIVKEKENKTKSGLVMMGTNETMYMLSAIISNNLLNIVTVAIIVLIVALGGIIKYTSPGVIFLVLCEYTIAMSTIGGIFSVFFPKQQQASSISLLFMFCSLALFGVCQIFLFWGSIPYNPTLENVAMLLPPIAIGRALNLIMTNEVQLLPFNITDSTRSVAPFYMLAVDTVLYWILLWYIDKLFPGEGCGVPQSFNFFLRPAFWFPSRAGSTVTLPLANAPVNRTDAPARSNSVEERFIEMLDLTQIPVANQNTLRVVGVTKIFQMQETAKPDTSSGSGGYGGGLIGSLIRSLSQSSTKTKYAVKDLSIDLHSDQILALLGHNGAGKTTLISMITGVLRPSHGHIYVRSLDGNTVWDLADPIILPLFRQHLGVCPQFDVLYPTLTVRETLSMFIELKGVTVLGKADGSASTSSNLRQQYIEDVARL